MSECDCGRNIVEAIVYVCKGCGEEIENCYCIPLKEEK